jgi:hypothetical protein
VARVVIPGVLATVVVVLLIGAVSQIGPASAPDRRTIDRSFAVLASPVAAHSNVSGASLRSFLRHAPTLDRATFFSDLDAVASATDLDAHQFAGLTPPVPSGGVAEMCGSTMDGRRSAAGRVRSALEGLLGGRGGHGGGNEAAAARQLQRAGTEMEAADSSWASCRKALRRGPGTAQLPVSTWVTNPSIWGATSVGRLVASLQGSSSLLPVHQVTLLTVALDPPAVPGADGVSILPPTGSLRFRVDLANTGNVDEADVELVLSAVPDGRARTPNPVRTRVAVATGRSLAVAPPPLHVVPGTSYVLHIRATASGSVATSSISVRVSLPPPTSTTTTTTAGTTTTGPTAGSTTSTTAHSG